MSSGGLAGSFSPEQPVPGHLLFLLAQVVYAAASVNFFLLAFIVFHAHRYFREGWTRDGWFFRTLVPSLVVIATCSLALQSAAAHWVLLSLYTGAYQADPLDWIDVVQRLLCFPTGILTQAFLTWRIFQISSARAIWLLNIALWIPPSVGYSLAEAFHILTLTNLKWAYAWRACELVGTASIFVLDVFYFLVLSWRLYIVRRKQVKPEVDPVSHYFISTLQISFFTCAITIGNLVSVSFLNSARIYIIYSFFLLILPMCWTLSVLWAINQRISIRSKINTPRSDDASFAQRLEVVGWRQHGARGRQAGEKDVVQDRSVMGQDVVPDHPIDLQEPQEEHWNDPSRWRGDDNDDLSSCRRTVTKKQFSEPDYSSVELDMGPLDKLGPVGRVHETSVSGIWVRTETTVQTTRINV
ncbi:uncharacterized protein JCM15063_001138 [Sporobolomyces koalae]|uniref:uncharacterized protein n=1 Tax=Sporobolomyces koalae TaxID=500713 RepID=UPI003180BABC